MVDAASISRRGNFCFEKGSTSLRSISSDEAAEFHSTNRCPLATISHSSHGFIHARFAKFTIGMFVECCQYCLCPCTEATMTRELVYRKCSRRLTNEADMEI